MNARRRSLVAVVVAAAFAAAALPASASADVLPLVGWWPMNEGTGQVVHDWSGHGNHGQLGNSPSLDSQDPTWIPGVFFGSALRFDGNDLVKIPDSSSLDPQAVTVAAWFRGTTSPGPNRYIVAKGSLTCERASYGLYSSSNGGLAFYIADATSWHRSPEAPPSVWDGRWHHAAGTFDGSTVRLFIDGVQVGSGTPASTSIAYNPPNGGGLIGSYDGSGSPDCDLFFTGDIDGVQIWSRALPVSDIWTVLKSLFTSSR